MVRLPEPEPDELVGQAGEPGSGPYLVLYVTVEQGAMVAARYVAHHCFNTHRCAKLICRWVVGRGPSDAARLTAPDLQTLVGGLPAGKEYCAELAVEAMHGVLNQLGEAA